MCVLSAAMKTDPPLTKVLCPIKMPAELLDQLHAIARAEDRPISTTVRRAIAAYVAAKRT